MKKTFVLLIFLLAATCRLSACEIRMNVDKDYEKEAYSAGDTVIVNVEVRLTHRVCPEGIKKTKFTCENLKIAGATEWKEMKPGLYARRVKAVITSDKSGDAKISAVRKCDREGGYGICLFGRM